MTSARLRASRREIRRIHALNGPMASQYAPNAVVAKDALPPWVAGARMAFGGNGSTANGQARGLRTESAVLV